MFSSPVSAVIGFLVEMSWLFGYRGNQPPPEGTQIPIPPSEGGGGGGSDDKNKKKAMEAYRFDSSALERAAQAAKDLERSSKYICITTRLHCGTHRHRNAQGRWEM